MVEFVQLLKEIGSTSLESFWLPVLLWTLMAGIATLLFRLKPSIPALYQYHGRVALLWTLPAGLCAAGLAKAFIQPASLADPIPVLIIQNPIAVAAPAVQDSVSWTNPHLLLGVATVLIACVAVLAGLKLLQSFIHLRRFSRSLMKKPAPPPQKLSTRNKQALLDASKPITVICSAQVEVPCTFGWRHKKIVLPKHLETHPQKLNMALRHELMHIRHHDYLLNTSLQWVKALFFFHPLVHTLLRQTDEYREMYCDLKVLADPDVSQKSYANLLFELAPKSLLKTTGAVNMAVRPSTLKKRIQTMKTQTSAMSSLKRSAVLMLSIGFFITGLIACSDVAENGITRAEVKQVQSGIQTESAPDNKPLYVINGEVWNNEEQLKTISLLKPKYIESVHVLKGKKAVAGYGQDGQNGVVKIKILNPEKAFSDLLDKPPTPIKPKPPTDEDIFIAVEQQPKLIGGIQQLQSHVTYPKSCAEAGIEGRVIIQFVVDEDGEVVNPQIIRGIGGGCDEAALEAVKKYAHFEPGRQRGKPVKVQFSLPILFRLPQPEQATGN